MGSADGSGVKARLAVDVTKNIEFGGTYTYDDAFESRVSADIRCRFNTNGGRSKETPKTNSAITALTSTPSNRDVRVHDSSDPCEYMDCSCGAPGAMTMNRDPITGTCLTTN